MPKLRKKILFATDYSQAADGALTYAASLARDAGAVLLVAHVSQLEQLPVGEIFDEEPQPSDEALAKLRAIKPPDPRIACEHRLLRGDPTEEIVKLADKEGVEAIVIGTHDRSRLARLLGGSVAENLLRAAHCPVIAYRHAETTAARDSRATEGETATFDSRRDVPSAAKKTARAVADTDLQRTVNEWAAHRSQLYNVFNKHGIDVLWDGHKRLIDACREKDINPQHLADDLAAASEPAYLIGHEVGQFAWEDAAANAGVGENHRHAFAVRGQCGGDFRTNESAANHGKVLSLGAPIVQTMIVIERAQIENVVAAKH